MHVHLTAQICSTLCVVMHKNVGACVVQCALVRHPFFGPIPWLNCVYV